MRKRKGDSGHSPGARSSAFCSEPRGRAVQSDLKQCPPRESWPRVCRSPALERHRVLLQFLCPSPPLSWGSWTKKLDPLHVLLDLPQMSPAVFVLTPVLTGHGSHPQSQKEAVLPLSPPSVILRPQQEGRPLIRSCPNLPSTIMCLRSTHEPCPPSTILLVWQYIPKA